MDKAGGLIVRHGAGRGFGYRDADGERVADEETLERIRELAIPPAWREVWVCPDRLGHLQATGIDAAGRKQYLYHERWQQRQAERKFATVREFAAALPRLRRAVTADLRRQGMPRERALACAVRLLDLGFFRVGGEVYAERRVQSIRDPAVQRAIEAMRRRRSGPEDLLAWREGREWRDVRSEDVNSYIQEKIGEDFSAKDFRTWHGTVLAAVELAGVPEPASEAAAKRSISAAVERVAEALGNTPAVCRRSYIDPRVIERFREGEAINSTTSVGGRMTARGRAKRGLSWQIAGMGSKGEERREQWLRPRPKKQKLPARRRYRVVPARKRLGNRKRQTKPGRGILLKGLTTRR